MEERREFGCLPITRHGADMLCSVLWFSDIPVCYTAVHRTSSTSICIISPNIRCTAASQQALPSPGKFELHNTQAYSTIYACCVQFTDMSHQSTVNDFVYMIRVYNVVHLSLFYQAHRPSDCNSGLLLIIQKSEFFSIKILLFWKFFFQIFHSKNYCIVTSSQGLGGVRNTM